VPVAVAVAFRSAGPALLCDPNGHTPTQGDPVIVELGKGYELARVRGGLREHTAAPGAVPLPRVLRRAGSADERAARENEARADRALSLCRERITAQALPMRLLAARYQLDRTQITFYFAADGRVDFRALIKDLAPLLKTRIQLHQTGAREAAKLLGGIGPCGRGLCCATWLTELAPVTMQMAREQQLLLNPTKFSGACGKLMCCLRFEYDLYREARQRLPTLGEVVETPDGPGQVTDVLALKESVRVTLKGGGEREYPAAQIERAVVRGCAVLAGGACAGGCRA